MSKQAGRAVGNSDDKKVKQAIKSEAIRRVPKTDPKALDKIKGRTKGK